MQFAVVDIETTGGFPAQHGITEIAIVLHNGYEVQGKFATLINPHQPIPPYIANMTGISNAMVATAPSFEEVAPYIFNLLQDKIFVAHNVNFDYSFVKHHLQQAGLQLQAPKLCTIRLSRKVFPGFAKYGLASLCHEFNIKNEARHRATGDALATAKVLELIVQKDGEATINQFLKKEKKTQVLPPNLAVHEVVNLPYEPGVYYFHDVKGKVIYVGKAKNLKFRVSSHFSGHDASKKRQDFIKNIHSISYQICATEFNALLLESIEIKRLWPAYNYSQKRFEQLWGIYLFEDNKGYKRLAIDKKRKYLQPVIAFGMMADAHRFMWKLVRDFELHPALCFLDKTKTQHTYPETNLHNKAIDDALLWMKEERKSYLIKENDFLVLVEEGKFYGMGKINDTVTATRVEAIKPFLKQYPENEVLKSMLNKFVEKNPSKVVAL
jgi:DNA polymerase III subunit epsilon